MMNWILMKLMNPLADNRPGPCSTRTIPPIRLKSSPWLTNWARGHNQPVCVLKQARRFKGPSSPVVRSPWDKILLTPGNCSNCRPRPR